MPNPCRRRGVFQVVRSQLNMVLRLVLTFSQIQFSDVRTLHLECIIPSSGGRLEVLALSATVYTMIIARLKPRLITPRWEAVASAYRTPYSCSCGTNRGWWPNEISSKLMYLCFYRCSRRLLWTRLRRMYSIEPARSTEYVQKLQTGCSSRQRIQILSTT